MHKLVPLVVLIATASAFYHASDAAEPRFLGPPDRPSAANVSDYGGAIVLVGGMGGTTGGGMGNATGGGMGNATGGGMGNMTGGGMGNMTGGGMPGMTGRGVGGTTGYGDPPSAGGAPYAGSETTADGPQHPQYYHCVTKHGRCSVSSELGALRTGASCSCMFGGKGKIR